MHTLFSFRRVTGSLGLALIGLLLTAATSAPSLHLALRRSDPSKDSVLTKGPTAITLWFTAKPELAVTTIALVDSSATKVELGAPRTDAADETQVIADVKGALRAGTYRVTWKTSSRDGHVIRGEFGFTLRPMK